MIFRQVVAAGALVFSMNCTQAALHDRGGGLLYDDTQNITWLQQINYGAGSAYDDFYFGTNVDGAMSWQNAVDWAKQLTYFDNARSQYLTNSGLPTIDELTNLYSEVASAGNSFRAGPFGNFHPDYYWSSSDYLPKSGYNSWAFWIGDTSGGQTDLLRVLDISVLVSSDGDVAAVPEPESYAMLIAGLGVVVLAGRRRKLHGKNRVN